MNTDKTIQDQSLREKALDWYFNFSGDEQEIVREKYFPGRLLLTGSEIEEIFTSEIEEIFTNEIIAMEPFPQTEQSEIDRLKALNNELLTFAERVAKGQGDDWMGNFVARIKDEAKQLIQKSQQ